MRVVAHFLDAQGMAQTPGSMAVPCVEYPQGRKRAKDFICTRKVGSMRLVGASEGSPVWGRGGRKLPRRTIHLTKRMRVGLVVEPPAHHQRPRVFAREAF